MRSGFRHSLRHLRPFCLGIAAAVMLAPAGATAAPPRVQDLRYGTVLFEFYQQNHFSALTELLAAQTQRRIHNHAQDAELLRGGLMLSYGLHDEAERIFRQLLTRDIEPDTRNRAWYYLARTTYEKGLYEEATAALEQIDEVLDVDLAGERQLLSALVKMANGDDEAAAAALQTWRGSEANRPYADYNRGIALIRSGQRAAGVEVLSAVSRLRTSDRDLQALRDKASMAAGFALLQAEQPAQAAPHLARVRVDGPLSNQALLLAGISESASGRHRQALVPLSVLEARSSADPAVQEALLAIPQAHANLGAYDQASALYERAIETLAAERRALARTMEGIEQGKLVAALVLEEELRERPQARANLPGQSYLVRLLAGHRFQQTFQNYLDLQALAENLAYWADSADSFEHMLGVQHARYSRELAAAEKRLEQLDKTGLRMRRRALLDRLSAVERRGEILALATEQERHQWQELLQLDSELSRLPMTDESIDLQLRFWRLVGGFVQELNRDFRPRLKSVQRELLAIGEEIDRIEQRQRAIAEVQRRMLRRFELLAGRVQMQRSEIERLQPQVKASIEAHQQELQSLALEELGRRHAQLEEQILQARFALARVHDQAAGARVREVSK
jgi:outer membrane protein assembly factor BamD (BamD/ComL family)